MMMGWSADRPYVRIPRFSTAVHNQMTSFVASAKETARSYSASAKIRDFRAQPDAAGCRFCQFQSICPEWQDFAEVDYDLAALRAAVGRGRAEAVAAIPGERDVFLCHVGREKEAIVRPMYRALEAAGITSWLDEAEILFGDSIIQKINEGLRTSRFLLCFLSEDFVGRGWPEGEMAAALSAELSSGGQRVLPVIVGEPEAILREYPLLRAKRYVSWADGADNLVAEIQRVLERERRKEL
jgi:hypothetical protein